MLQETYGQSWQNYGPYVTLNNQTVNITTTQCEQSTTDQMRSYCSKWKHHLMKI